MRILVAVEELRVGGAQTFALRLAEALAVAGHDVYLYCMYWQYTEHELVRRLAPSVRLVQYEPAYRQVDTLLVRAEGWLFRRGIRLEWRQRRLVQHLRRVLAEQQIEAVSSNTFKCDALLAQALHTFPRVPLIVTMHGDYEQFLRFSEQGRDNSIPGFKDLLSQTLQRVNGIAYLSEQNLECLRPEVAGVSTSHILVRKIYNGLSGHVTADAARYNRSSLGISPQALIMGMVARGVPEKGWEPVITAFQRLNKELAMPMYLVLVGASPFLTELERKYHQDKSLRFLGFVNNPIDCIESFDVGILASSLKESLPNSIAEYLFCGKAVISTDVGEIRQMIRTDEGQEAGILIDFPAEGLADPNQLYEAMKSYALNTPLLYQHQEWARQAFAKFDMSRCIAAYTELYQDCMQQPAQAY